MFRQCEVLLFYLHDKKHSYPPFLVPPLHLISPVAKDFLLTLAKKPMLTPGSLNL